MSGFTRTAKPSPLLRHPYLQSLEEPQEWFLEELVNSGQFWTHPDGSYCVTNGAHLVEFFSANAAITDQRLRDFCDQHGVSEALVKSFDRDLVRSFELLGWTASVAAHLFRKRASRDHKAVHGAEMHAATSSDVDAIWRINTDFFASATEIAHMAQAGTLWTVRVTGDIVGCGTSIPVIAGGDAVDVGMMVAPHLRRRGLGTYIASEVANRIERAGLRPICGCAVSNTASKLALESAGFVSDHQLLSVKRACRRQSV